MTILNLCFQSLPLSRGYLVKRPLIRNWVKSGTGKKTVRLISDEFSLSNIPGVLCIFASVLAPMGFHPFLYVPCVGPV